LAEFRNPNLQTQGSGDGGGGGDMRSLLTFTSLALVLLLGYQYFFKPKQNPPAPTVQSQSQQSVASVPTVPQQMPQGTMAQPQAMSATPAITATEVTLTTVENANYKIVFSNKGAQAEHWILQNKQYKDHAGADGHQLDLINPKAVAFGLPLSIYTYEPELTKQLNEALYQVSVSGTNSSTGSLQAPGSITYHYAANGIDAVKTFRFDASYVISAEVAVTRNGSPVRALLAWPAGLGDQTTSMDFANGNKFIWSLYGKDDSIVAKKLSGNATLEQPYDFAAVSDLYFAAAFMPDVPSRTTVVTIHNAIELSNDPTSQKRPADVIGLAVGDVSGPTRLRLFAGPKETDLLKSIHSTGADGKLTGPSIEPLIQLGWLTVIAKPLYLALRFLKSSLGSGADNWGWAIILFTTIFTLVTLPLRFMAMKSSLKMMRIQPKVDAVKNRYRNVKATDPKRAEMNTEMMDLYKTEGVNMYGGCLPMLPQMPLFIAYYSVLRNAVELRQAHWFWLNDLSVADPHYILPGIIIAFMFLTQWKTPSPGIDPAQRRMMAIMMPVMMGFMFGNLASGLALYMAASSLINLALQLAINQSSMGEEMHAIAARRAAKKSGNTINGQIQKRK
jgi:YidC/Oxa1 family membrane protein insertase